MKLYQPSTIKQIQDVHDFRPTKTLGQNFLSDKNIIDKIIDSAEIGPNDLVIEIGPGLGVITQEIAEKAEKVVAVEIDTNLIPILANTLADYDNVEIVNQDILKTDVNEIIGRAKTENTKAVKVIGNLPYYITTPIIMKLLEDNLDLERIVIMMQKEVADRIKAKPGGKDYGSITVAVQYYCEVETAVNAPKEAFIPRPQVDSTVLVLKLREEAAAETCDKELFFSTVRAGFNQRRKTLSNSLMGVDKVTKEIVYAALEKAGVDPKRRAETLSIKEFADVANAIYELRK